VVDNLHLGGLDIALWILAFALVGWARRLRARR